MASADTFHCQLITPEEALLDSHANCVVVTAHDGEVGNLSNREPLLCKLGIGELRVTTPEGTQHFYVDGGFVHVLDNEVTVLTPQAIPAEQLDAERAEQELGQLRRVGGGVGEDARTRATRILRAKTIMRLASRT